MYDEAACLGWCKAQENSVSSGGISSVGQSQFGAGKVSLFSDLIGDRPTSVRGEILIKRVHCVSYVLLSGVCVRRGLAFPYVIIIIIIMICSCLRRKALRSLGREGKPDFGE